MSRFEAVRQAAREAFAWPDPATDYVGLVRVVEALAHHDIELALQPTDDNALAGANARLERHLGLIYVRDDLSDAQVATLCAHELGHLILHPTSIDERSAMGDDLSSQVITPSSANALTGYGPSERREVQANIFAREFLLPGPLLTTGYIDQKLTATALAKQYQMEQNLVVQQLTDLVLLPTAPAPARRKEQLPNDAQHEAARHTGSALLVEAAPGTGKTSTLVHRVLHLLAKGVTPDQIVVLTYSTKAANELIERIEHAAPQQAYRLWCGTIHAFGLDLLRRYHDLLDVSPRITLLDTSDLVERFETLLPTLPLNHYRNLSEPAHALRELLSTVARAKEELIDADHFDDLAQGEHVLGFADSDRGEKMLEVAAFYKVYEKHLNDAALLDYADLILKPIALFESHAQALNETRLRHQHFLIDEYQDVNRACARLLQLLTAPDDTTMRETDRATHDRLWAVGDARQSIYRFRGASAANVVRFEDDFPDGSRLRLSVNYRSTQSINALVTHFANETDLGPQIERFELTSDRNEAGAKPEVTIVRDLTDQIDTIAQRIERHVELGNAWSAQAVLCRTHEQAAQLAQSLSAKGIPVLYLGSVLERPEIRDLLSLMLFCTNDHAQSLLRIAAMPAYRLEWSDVRALSDFMQSCPGTGFDALEELVPDCDDNSLSSAGQDSIRNLFEDLKGINRFMGPYEVLCHLLFGKPRILEQFLVGSSDELEAQLQRVAIYQLLRLTNGAPNSGDGQATQHFLAKLRLKLLLKDDRDLRQIPPECGPLNGVHVMTVHSAKGLEFDAVHLPNLYKTHFPQPFRQSHCPVPTGIIRYPNHYPVESPEKVAHQEEEESLFFVAMSRARDRLHLYYPQHDGRNQREPSQFLYRLGEISVENDAQDYDDEEPRRSKHKALPLTPDYLAEPLRLVDIIHLQDCPRRYYYNRELALARHAVDSPFRRMRTCVQIVIDSLRNVPNGQSVNEEKMLATLDSAWRKVGPESHALSNQYKTLAQQVTRHLHERFADLKARQTEPIWVEFDNGGIIVEPSFVGYNDSGVVHVRLVRYGRSRRESTVRTLHNLLCNAAMIQFADEQIVVEFVNLSDRSIQRIDKIAGKQQQIMKKNIEDALWVHETRRFAPRPAAERCARCPHFIPCQTLPS